jgi:hypothetical protein
MQMEESKENVKKGLVDVVKVNDQSGILFVHSLQIGIQCSDRYLQEKRPAGSYAMILSTQHWT